LRFIFYPRLMPKRPPGCAAIAALTFAFTTLLSARADTSLTFNEIHYHPATNEALMEWVELYNQMAVDVDISGWALDGGVHYVFPSNTIVRGGGFLLVGASPDTLAGMGLANVLGPFAGRLSNSGEQFLLRNNSGRVVDQVTYGIDGDWPVAPNGSGFSLAKLDHDNASGPAARPVGKTSEPRRRTAD
jgi:hypothetical protein